MRQPSLIGPILIAYAAVVAGPAWARQPPAPAGTQLDPAPVAGRPAVATPPGPPATNPSPQIPRSPLDIALVRTGWYDEWLARLLLPRAMLLKDRSIPIDLPAPRPGSAAGTSSFVANLVADGLAQGQISGLFMRAAQAGETPQGPTPALAVNDVRLTGTGRAAWMAVHVDVDQLPPDRYVGSVGLLSPQLSEGLLSIPIDLKVREGPFLPLLTVLAGVVIGRLVQLMNAPRAQLQLRLLPRIDQIRSNSRDILDPQAAGFLNQRLEDLRSRVESAGEPEATLAQEVDRLEAQLRSLSTLQGLHREVGFVTDLDVQHDIDELIRKARVALVTNDPAGFQLSLQQINQQLASARDEATQAPALPVARRAIPPFVLQTMQDHVDAAIAASPFPAPMAAPPGAGGAVGSVGTPSPRWLRWLQQGLSALSGTRQISGRTWVQTLQPLLFLVLLALLILTGLKSFYIDTPAGSTFGATGLYDHLGLFLWGLSADVAQRTLQQIARPTPT